MTAVSMQQLRREGDPRAREEGKLRLPAAAADKDGGDGSTQRGGQDNEDEGLLRFRVGRMGIGNV